MARKVTGLTGSRRRRWLVLGVRSRIAALAALVGVAIVGVLAAVALAGAVSTSQDPGFVGTYTDGTTTTTYTSQACTNGNGTNCNIYLDKRDVFFSGLPNAAALPAGTYYFAVLDPGGQRDPNDGSIGNLSSGFDAYTNRTFATDGAGNISYSGTHNIDGNLLQVFPFANTNNNGGVYILAICGYDPNDSTTYPVDPHNCKYDAFKVLTAPPCDPTTDPTCQPPPPPSSDLVVTKNATPSWARDYEWAVSKKQTTSSNPIDAGGSSTNVAYKVQATWSVNSDTYAVGGTIHVQNPNTYDVTGVDVTDAVYSDNIVPTLDGNIGCTVQAGSYTVNNVTTSGISSSNGTVPAGVTVDYPYTCTVTGTPSGTEYNQATATADLSNALPDAAATSDFVGFTWPASPSSTTNSCTTVSDTWSDTNVTTQLGNVCVDGTATAGSLYTGSSPLSNFSASYDIAPFTTNNPANTWTFTYTRAVTVTADQCVTHNNTATVTDGGTGSSDDDSTTDDDSSSASVTVCGAASGGLTMGFWQNKNGQGIISGQAASGTCPSAAYLRQFAPFTDLSATAKCSDVASYVSAVIKAATCSSTSKTCNTMLKAQMLATALDVYFSGSTSTTCGVGIYCGGDKIKPFNGGNSVFLGGLNIDLTKICNMIDGSSSSSCSGANSNASSVFGGATCETVLAALLYQNTTGTQTNPATIPNVNTVTNAGLTAWYSQYKPSQVLAKNVFDAFNNQVAFTC